LLRRLEIHRIAAALRSALPGELPYSMSVHFHRIPAQEMREREPPIDSVSAKISADFITSLPLLEKGVSSFVKPVVDHLPVNLFQLPATSLL
jgi:hypothetical protein